MVVFAALLAVAVYDLLQRRHSILRNYPVLGHLRFLLEDIRPELQQYFIERNCDGRPFDRDTRSVVYERAKGIQGEQPFGTELDVYAARLRVPRALRRPGRAGRRPAARARSAARTAPSPTTWRCSTSRR